MLAVAVSAVLRKAPSKGSQEDAGVALAGDMGCGDRNRFLSLVVNRVASYNETPNV